MSTSPIPRNVMKMIEEYNSLVLEAGLPGSVSMERTISRPPLLRTPRPGNDSDSGSDASDCRSIFSVDHEEMNTPDSDVEFFSPLMRLSSSRGDGNPGLFPSRSAPCSGGALKGSGLVLSSSGHPLCTGSSQQSKVQRDHPPRESIFSPRSCHPEPNRRSLLQKMTQSIRSGLATPRFKQKRNDGRYTGSETLTTMPS